jgi:hypothetical protein
MLTKGLAKTSALWEPIQTAFDWLHSAAYLLKNEVELAGQQVKRRFIGLVGAMKRWQTKAGELAPAIAHFLKVTRSYWSGLFHCYDVPGLPRTNNDLEHLFGSQRYHERRTTGRKLASPSLVVRGSVRIVATVMTRLHPFSAPDLRPESVEGWQSLRAKLVQQRQPRILQRRFRQDPETYLIGLEERLNKLILPL